MLAKTDVCGGSFVWFYLLCVSLFWVGVVCVIGVWLEDEVWLLFGLWVEGFLYCWLLGESVGRLCWV